MNPVDKKVTGILPESCRCVLYYLLINIKNILFCLATRSGWILQILPVDESWNNTIFIDPPERNLKNLYMKYQYFL